MTGCQGSEIGKLIVTGGGIGRGVVNRDIGIAIGIRVDTNINLPVEAGLSRIIPIAVTVVVFPLVAGNVDVLEVAEVAGRIRRGRFSTGTIYACQRVAAGGSDYITGSAEGLGPLAAGDIGLIFIDHILLTGCQGSEIGKLIVTGGRVGRGAYNAAVGITIGICVDTNVNLPVEAGLACVPVAVTVDVFPLVA